MSAVVTSLRTFLVSIGAFALLSCGGGEDGPASPDQQFHPSGSTIPISGPDVPGVQAFDERVTDFMRRKNIPGVTLAVAKNGRLILARGYGYADFEAKQQVEPDSMYRTASIAKTLTVLAIGRLRDQGLMDVDERFLDILTEYEVPTGGDGRLHDITVRHLLMHQAGWNRDTAGDPLFMNDRISNALGVAKPVTCRDITRFMMGQPLQFAPGTRMVYSNFGYCILGQIVEKISGQAYEHYVRDQVLAPLGIYAMSIAQARVEQRGPFEVKYYGFPGEPYEDSVFPNEGKVPAPYSFEPMTHAASGGWVASAIDLTRVMTAIDGSRIPGFLSAETREMFTAKPSPNFIGTSWYGFGLFVGPTVDTYFHSGLLPGLVTLMHRDASGYSFAVMLNSRPRALDGFFAELTATVMQAIGDGFDGSPADLYASYPSPSLPSRTP